jgi:2'-5' RNA ligase
VADDPTTRRLFFALGPTETQRRATARPTADVAAHAGGRKIPAENFHITLIFLGSVPQDRVDEAVRAACEVVARPFELILDRIESWRRAGVLCLTAQAPAELDVLRSRLGARLSERQFTLEEGPFQPHVTLVRRLPRSVPGAAFDSIAWQVDEFVLVESKTNARGSQYEVVRRWLLGP